MQVTVMSRKNALKYFMHLTREEKENIACISITGMEDEPVSKWHYPKTTLFLTFDDVDRADGDEIPMSHYEANQIAFFVKGIAKDESINSLIVHCEAGMSRSAGVAAAIMKYLFGTDEAIFGIPSYRPNMLCYRRTLEALMDNATDLLTEDEARKILTASAEKHAIKNFKINKMEFNSISPAEFQMTVFECSYVWNLNGWDKNVTQWFAVYKFSDGSSMVDLYGMTMMEIISKDETEVIIHGNGNK